MFAGLVWACGLLFVTGEYLGPPNWGDPIRILGGAIWPCGMVFCAMVGRLAQRRFFDDQIIDGQPFPEGSGGAIDQNVTTNTLEQLVLALCLWPFVWLQLGDAAVQVLGVSLAVTRLAFWIGYHTSSPLRGFGFAAGFYPTILFTALSAYFLFVR